MMNFLARTLAEIAHFHFFGQPGARLAAVDIFQLLRLFCLDFFGISDKMP
ncbi:MAG: hypothetical protein K1X65_08055 [Caldilineales bacterium]|nr:hypothetical protein [Caldilineales bacterium]MCW5858967.1 hypothetical protein [Caldilineales bacterium]